MTITEKDITTGGDIWFEIETRNKEPLWSQKVVSCSRIADELEALSKERFSDKKLNDVIHWMHIRRIIDTLRGAK